MRQNRRQDDRGLKFAKILRCWPSGFVENYVVKVCLFSCLSAVLFCSLAKAEPQRASSRGSAQNSTSAATSTNTEKRTTVNFDDQLIEGQTQKPELFYLLQQRNTGFKRLIKLRENFLPEMRKTAEDVSRSGASR